MAAQRPFPGPEPAQAGTLVPGGAPGGQNMSIRNLIIRAITGAAAPAIILMAGHAFAQEPAWKNPGNYDYAGHLAKTPGDVDLPPGIPAGFDAAIAHPAGMDLQVSGLDFLSDGRMVLAEWIGFGKQGRISLVENLGGDVAKVKATVIAKGLWEPMGVKVIKDVIYFTAQDGLYKLTRGGSAGAEQWEVSQHAKFIIPIKSAGGDFPIAFNTAFQGGNFYFSTGAYKNFNPSPMNQGFVVKIPLAQGQQEIMARGIRMPNGLAANADGEMFFSDNQGEYRPYSGIFHVVKGRHYGMAAPDGKDGNLGGAMTKMLPLPPKDSITPPAVEIPYRPGSASATNLFLLDQTPFAGQFLVGDNAFGGVHRVFTEKVKGEYQGAYFQFSTVLEGGIQSFCKGPDGSIYGGTLGMGANGWSVQGRETGLMKWKMNGSAFNAIVTASSQREGFDLRFTDPLAANVANPDWYWVTSYRYEPTAAYGGPKLDTRRERIASLRMSVDRKTLAIAVEGLTAGRVYRIILASEVKTAVGAALATRNVWYTLNRISDAEPLAGPVALAPTVQASAGAQVIENRGAARVRLTGPGPYSIRVLNARGALVGQASGTGIAGGEITVPGSGLRLLQVTTGTGSFSKLVKP